MLNRRRSDLHFFCANFSTDKALEYLPNRFVQNAAHNNLFFYPAGKKKPVMLVDTGFAPRDSPRWDLKKKPAMSPSSNGHVGSV